MVVEEQTVPNAVTVLADSRGLSLGPACEGHKDDGASKGSLSVSPAQAPTPRRLGPGVRTVRVREIAAGARHSILVSECGGYILSRAMQDADDLLVLLKNRAGSSSPQKVSAILTDACLMMCVLYLRPGFHMRRMVCGGASSRSTPAGSSSAADSLPEGLPRGAGTAGSCGDSRSGYGRRD